MIARLLTLSLFGLTGGGSLFAATLELRGLAPADEIALHAELPDLFTKTVTPARLDEAVRRLYLRGRFEDVVVEKDARGNYTLTAQPRHVVSAVNFHGINKADQQEIKDLLTFKAGDRFDHARVTDDAERLKNYYGEHGFFNAVIEVSFTKGTDDNVTVTFEIQEKEPCVIRGLEFKTANTDLKARLTQHFSHQRERALATERVRKLQTEINELLISDRYLSAEVIGPEVTYDNAKTKAYLKFEVREPWRYEFYMKGQKILTLTDLYHALDLSNRERRSLDPASEGAERLRRGYLERGFPWVQLETKVVNPPKTYLRRIYYTINEGARVRLGGIEVQGRISRGMNYYREFIANNSSPLVGEGFFNRQDLENGFKNLVTDLRNQGFLRARVLSSRVEFNAKRDRATVYLLLEEGPQTEIRALEFVGNKFFSSFELTTVTGLETNSALHLNAFEASLDKLKSFYLDHGFLEMKLENEKDDLIVYNDKGTEARIRYRIYEGPRVRIRNIVVEGNSKTHASVILKEANFAVGDVLTPTQIETATARLNRLGLFSRTDIHTSDEGTTVAERTLVISVSERDPGQFNFGGGVTNERNLTVRGFAGTSYNNLWGTARAVSLRGELKQNVAQINYLEHEVTVGYLEPFLFDTRTRGRVTVTSSEHVFDYSSNYSVTKITQSNRFDFNLERDVTLHTKVTWKLWGLESNKEYERYGRCIPDDESIAFDPSSGKCPPDTLQIATLGPTVDIDYRDSPFLPTRGSRLLVVTNYSDPNFGSSSGVKFIRAEANFTHYTRLGRPNLVWANSLRGGYVSNLSHDPGAGVPTPYAFLLGGIYSVRGFDMSSDNERIPKQGNGGFNVERGNQKLIPADSDYFLVKTELRFPIVGEHGGVIFYDAGDVFVRHYVFDRPYRDAVGFGYRYNTPVGPLALDVAFKIAPEQNESPVRFHLSIGTF